MKKNYTYLIIFILISIIIFSIFRIIKWNKDNTVIINETEEINKNIIINEVEDNKNTNEIDKSNIYFDYTKMKLIDVDFSNLKEINNDTVGWIQVVGTNINYPVVQTKNNDYYLNHSFEKKNNEAGWIFMDYRNSINEFDTNTIIYGHNRFNKTMFGTLKDTTKKKWFNNKDNHIIKLSLEKSNTLWQVFSVYKIATTNDYLLTKFNNDMEYTIFIRNLITRSIFDFKTDVNTNDKILTLSTCNGSKEKLVLHAKLIKIMKKGDKNE